MVLTRAVGNCNVNSTTRNGGVTRRIGGVGVSNIHRVHSHFGIPISSTSVRGLPCVAFPRNSRRRACLRTRHRGLRNCLPDHRPGFARGLRLPDLRSFNTLLRRRDGRVSAAVTFIHTLGMVLGGGSVGSHLMPVVTSRTHAFNVRNLFHRVNVCDPGNRRCAPRSHRRITCCGRSRGNRVLRRKVGRLNTNYS